MCIRDRIGLDLPQDRFTWSEVYLSRSGDPIWFLVGSVSAEEVAQMRLGDEGQACWVMPAAAFLEDPEAIPHLRDKLQLYLDLQRE